MQHQEPSPEASGERPAGAVAKRARDRLGQLQVWGAAGVLGLLTALGGLMLWTAATHDHDLPELTVEAFEQGQARWRAAAPPDYDITIEVSGRQAAVYHVEVRNRQVVVSTRNGIPLKQQRTRGTWSVPGMFGTIQSDVDHAEQHRQGTAGPGVPQVVLFAVFDPTFGYPQRYHRTELQKSGNNRVVYWDVTQFDVVATGSLRGAESGKSDQTTLE